MGVVCEPDAASVASAIEGVYVDGNLERFCSNFEEERKRFSWEAMCDALMQAYEECLSKP